VHGRRSVMEAVQMAAQARMRVRQIENLESQLTGIIFDLRKRGDRAGANKLDDLQKEYQSVMDQAAKYLDDGLRADALHDIDLQGGKKCAEFEVPFDDEPEPFKVIQGKSLSTKTSHLAAQALSWSADQMTGGSGKGVNSNNGLSISRSAHAWNSYCLAFVATAYGREVPLLSAPSAIQSYKKFLNAGKIVNSRKDIPVGAPMFFKATRANGYWGHIVIFTGRYSESGEPIVRSTGWKSWRGIHEVPLSKLESTGAYTGYGIVD